MPEPSKSPKKSSHFKGIKIDIEEWTKKIPSFDDIKKMVGLGKKKTEPTSAAPAAKTSDSTASLSYAEKAKRALAQAKEQAKGQVKGFKDKVKATDSQSYVQKAKHALEQAKTQAKEKVKAAEKEVKSMSFDKEKMKEKYKEMAEGAKGGLKKSMDVLHKAESKPKEDKPETQKPEDQASGEGEDKDSANKD